MTGAQLLLSAPRLGFRHPEGGRLLLYSCNFFLLGRRLNIGGKALTNVLKETVSFRAFNLQDETLLMDAVKEQLCFVSMRPLVDLRLAK